MSVKQENKTQPKQEKVASSFLLVVSFFLLGYELLKNILKFYQKNFAILKKGRGIKAGKNNFILGKRCLKMGNLQMAKFRFKLARMFHSHYKTSYYLALIYSSQRKLKQALFFTQESIDLGNKHPDIFTMKEKIIKTQALEHDL